MNFPAPNEEIYLIDAIEGVRFSREEAPTANFHAINYGPIGLELIARNVWQGEQSLKNTRLVFVMPQTTAEAGVLTSYFYWFAVTLVNHARLVGMLSYLHKNGLRDASLMDGAIRRKAVESTNAYVKSIIPEVLTWRNKIGAHYAFTDPRSDDTIHDLQQSVMMNVSFVRLRWRACGMRWADAVIPEWSITEEMERLAPRFWPNFKFQ